MPVTNSKLKGFSISTIFLISFTLLLLLKIFFASALDLYSDEIFYWQASSLPAIAYSDLPFITAFLVGIGSLLDSDNPLAVRTVFILIGSSIPFLVYWLALPITNSKDALESAFLSLCLPLLGFLGLLAVPDVPLAFFGILSIGFFERALRTNLMRFWLATGIFVALGLSTHYRFFLYPIAVILFLSIFKPAQKQWKNPRLWVCIILASFGLIPILWFNFSYNFESAAFYFIDRHPWEFNSAGLLHILEQAAVSSPPMYILFLTTIHVMIRKSREKFLPAALLLSFSLTNLIVYFALAPWTDADSTTIHWPLSGYLPLLVFLPEGIRFIYAWACSKQTVRFSRILVNIIPAVGLCGTFAALIGIGSQAFQTSLQKILGDDILSTKMAGWRQFAEHTHEVISDIDSNTRPIIVTDNYYTAAQLEFAGVQAKVYTIDKSKAERDGRIRQYRIWKKHENGLTEHFHKPVLFITEDSTLTTPEKHEIIQEMCQYSDELTFVDKLNLFDRAKTYSYYLTNKLLAPETVRKEGSPPCPFPPRAWIDSPQPEANLSGKFIISGWAYNQDLGIRSVQIMLNKVFITEAIYGFERNDVVRAMKVQNDPNIPNLGFEVEIDTTDFENGNYWLELGLVSSQGNILPYGKRSITINNP